MRVASPFLQFSGRASPLLCLVWSHCVQPRGWFVLGGRTLSFHPFVCLMLTCNFVPGSGFAEKYGGSDSKEPPCQCRRPRFDPRARKIPWRRPWQPSPVFLPGESHGQRSLTGYSPWGYKELDKTKQLTHTQTYYY